MRLPAVLCLAALLSLSGSAVAHGDHDPTVLLTLTGEGCTFTGPPCILVDGDGSVLRGTSAQALLQNDLDNDVDVLVYLDDGGSLGALVGDARTATAGAAASVPFDVPADATGVWYVTLQGGQENARLFGLAIDDEHTDGEDSPGPGAVALLAALALVGVAVRRRA